MSNILVSVIMPVFNSEKYVNECIQSIIEQTFPNFELIIIDDYSTDHTINKVIEFNDARVILLRNNLDKGISNCLNLGISKASGKYIARMDGDDICIRDRLAKQVEYMEVNSEIGVLGTRCREFGEVDTRSDEPIHNDDIRMRLLQGAPFCHPTTIIRKNLFMKYQYCNRYDNAEDYKLWVDMAIGGVVFANLEEALLLKRNHVENISKVKRSRQLYLTDLIRREYFQFYFSFLSESEIDIICARRSDYEFNVQDFNRVIKHILSYRKSNHHNSHDIALVYKDSIYKLNPYFSFMEYAVFMKYKYPYQYLSIMDLLRLFKRAILN